MFWIQVPVTMIFTLDGERFESKVVFANFSRRSGILALSSYVPYIDATSVRAVGAQERSVGMRIEGLTTFVKQGIE